MFDNLSDKLEKALHNLKGHGKITEINVAETLKEVRRALLDADVNYKIAKDFTNTVKENNKTMEEAASALTERYFNNIHCACFTPNPERIDDILRLAKEYQVDGILNVNLKFCNLYATENYFVERRLKDEGYKVLSLETDYEDSDAEQLRTRVSAFLEMIEANK